MSDLNKARLLHEIQSTGQDFKASIVAAELANHGIPADIFYFRNQSTFKRPVSRDIETVSWHNGDDTNQPDSLVFDLNREGIYDMLPEELIHAQRRRTEDEPEYKMGRELRRQELDARKFFSPLENEFHHRSLKLDIVERELLKNNNPDRNREFFNYFFEDDSALSDQQLLVLLHILPLCHKIRGDMSLISLTIERIIGYHVEVIRKWSIKAYPLPAHTALPLGEGRLGTETVLNDMVRIPSTLYEVCISDVPTAAYKDFSGKGKHLSVLHFVLPYFFPVNAEYRVVLRPEIRDKTFVVAEDHAHSFLGFNSYI